MMLRLLAILFEGVAAAIEAAEQSGELTRAEANESQAMISAELVKLRGLKGRLADADRADLANRVILCSDDWHKSPNHNPNPACPSCGDPRR